MFWFGVGVFVSDDMMQWRRLWFLACQIDAVVSVLCPQDYFVCTVFLMISWCFYFCQVDWWIIRWWEALEAQTVSSCFCCILGHFNGDKVTRILLIFHYCSVWPVGVLFNNQHHFFKIKNTCTNVICIYTHLTQTEGAPSQRSSF